MNNPETIYPDAKLVADIIKWLTDNGHATEVRGLTDALEDVKVTPMGGERAAPGDLSVAELGRRIQGEGQSAGVPGSLDRCYVPIDGELGVRIKKLMAAAGPDDVFAQAVAYRCVCPPQPPMPTPIPSPTPTPKPPKPKR